MSTPLAWDEVPGCDPAAFTIDTVPARFAAVGDPWAGMDDAAGSLEALLELAARDEASGLPDAPWPPHYEKQAGEAPRVQPSKRRATRRATADRPHRAAAGPSAGRRKPLIEIARAATKDEAMEGLERWKARHPDVWPQLRARRRAGRRDARPQLRLDPDPAQPGARARGRSARRRSRWRSTTTPGAASTPARRAETRRNQ